jgi:hypothetical protein
VEACVDENEGGDILFKPHAPRRPNFHSTRPTFLFLLSTVLSNRRQK